MFLFDAPFENFDLIINSRSMTDHIPLKVLIYKGFIPHTTKIELISQTIATSVFQGFSKL
jgi:hypothetical protein